MPIILLSATAPPSLENRLLKTFWLDPNHTAFLRSTTNRPEIGFHVIHLAPLTADGTLARFVHALLGRLKDKERILVFFPSCTLAESFARDHNFAVYHSKLTEGEQGKKANMVRWDRGETKVMACTSAFGSGVDYPNVRYVVTFDSIYGLMTTLQMAGRAGRDGKESHAFFLTSQTSPPCKKDGNGDLAWELGQFAHTDQCRVYQAMFYMDGAEMARKCDQLPAQVPCDVCRPEGEMHQFALSVVKEAIQELSTPDKRMPKASIEHKISYSTIGTGFTAPSNVLAHREMQTSKSRAFSDVPPHSLDTPCMGDLFKDQRSPRMEAKVCTLLQNMCDRVMTNNCPRSRLHNRTPLQGPFRPGTWCLCPHSQTWVLTETGLEGRPSLSKLDWIALHVWTDICHVSKGSVHITLPWQGLSSRTISPIVRLSAEFHSAGGGITASSGVRSASKSIPTATAVACRKTGTITARDQGVMEITLSRRGVNATLST